jgi:hypothetical protein
MICTICECKINEWFIPWWLENKKNLNFKKLLCNPKGVYCFASLSPRDNLSEYPRYGRHYNCYPHNPFQNCNKMFIFLYIRINKYRETDRKGNQESNCGDIPSLWCFVWKDTLVRWNNQCKKYNSRNDRKNGEDN